MWRFIVLLFAIIPASTNAFLLNLEEAKEIALKNNPEFLAEKEAVNAAISTANQSKFNLLPQASLSGSYNKNEETELTSGDGESRSFGFQVTQPIFNGGKNWLNMSMKNLQSDIQGIDYYSKKLEVLRETESRYFQVLESKKLLEISEDNDKIANRNLETAEIRYKSGSLSRADYLKMRAEKASREVELIQAKSSLKNSRNSFSSYLQISRNFILESIPIERYNDYLNSLKDFTPEKVDEISDKIISIGIERSPEIKKMELNLKLQEKSVTMAKGDFLPSVNLSYSENWRSSEMEEDYISDGWRIGVSASVPIFPVVDNVYSLNREKYSLKEMQYLYNATKNDVELTLESFVEDIVSSAKAVYSSEIGLEYAKETFRQSEVRFKNNVITATELLDTQVLLNTSSKQYYTSFYDFLRARTSLMKQLGIEDEDSLWVLLK
jgi:outer membrane protein